MDGSGFEPLIDLLIDYLDINGGLLRRDISFLVSRRSCASVQVVR